MTGDPIRNGRNQDESAKITAGYPNIHPSDRRTIRSAITEHCRDNHELFWEELEKLGVSGRNHRYLPFSRHDPRQDDKVNFALKCCIRCFKSKNHSHCSIERMSWVWDEAIRREDDHLFVPIIEAHPSEGWFIMLDGDAITTSTKIPDEVKNVLRKGKWGSTIKDNLWKELRDSGWNITTDDAEPKVVPDRTGKQRSGIIDYEYAYPESMFGTLYVSSFDNLIKWDDYSERTKEELRDRDMG